MLGSRIIPFIMRRGRETQAICLQKGIHFLYPAKEELEKEQGWAIEENTCAWHFSFCFSGFCMDLKNFLGSSCFTLVCACLLSAEWISYARDVWQCFSNSMPPLSFHVWSMHALRDLFCFMMSVLQKCGLSRFWAEQICSKNSDT